MRPRAFKQEPDEALISDIIEKKLPPLLRYIEGELPEQGFVFGAFSLADLTLVTPFINASYAGYDIPRETYPKFTTLFDAVKTQTVVEKILSQEAKALGFS
jgi:glutathione S-transferase